MVVGALGAGRLRPLVEGGREGRAAPVEEHDARAQLGDRLHALADLVVVRVAGLDLDHKGAPLLPGVEGAVGRSRGSTRKSGLYACAVPSLRWTLWIVGGTRFQRKPRRVIMAACRRSRRSRSRCGGARVTSAGTRVVGGARAAARRRAPAARVWGPRSPRRRPPPRRHAASRWPARAAIVTATASSSSSSSASFSSSSGAATPSRSSVDTTRWRTKRWEGTLPE